VPTYVYACQQCDARVEVVQKMSDDPLTTCEACGGSLRRVLFAPAVVYKGSGFYTTDYKNGGRKSESTTSSDTASGTDAAKTDTKTETKAETKSETSSEPSSTPAKKEAAV
jgi:putative FmdB family regulatory protein